ncbi:MAG: hypothetical protein QME76_12525 [Bacillota bacterium]|nr:hypothetical protein [Bacillota bacterium]
MSGAMSGMKQGLKRANCYRPVPIVERNGHLFCADFDRGQDGFCRHYTGPKPAVASCADQCTAVRYKFIVFDVSD